MCNRAGRQVTKPTPQSLLLSFPRPPVGLEDFQEAVSWDQKPGRPGPEPAFVGEGPVPGQGRCPSPPTAMAALLVGPTAVAQEGRPSASWRMQRSVGWDLTPTLPAFTQSLIRTLSRGPTCQLHPRPSQPSKWHCQPLPENQGVPIHPNFSDPQQILSSLSPLRSRPQPTSQPCPPHSHWLGSHSSHAPLLRGTWSRHLSDRTISCLRVLPWIPPQSKAF